MKLFEHTKIEMNMLSGGKLQLAAGQIEAVSMNAVITSDYVRHSEESGSMSPRHHTEEMVYILKTVDDYVCYEGLLKEACGMGDLIVLKPGLMLHFPSQECMFSSMKKVVISKSFFPPQTPMCTKKYLLWAMIDEMKNLHLKKNK